MKRDALRIAFLLIALTLACSRPPLRGPVLRWEGEQGMMELSYHGQARSVRVAGDFNGWNPEADPFIPDGQGEWRCVLNLPPGRYAYLLVLETDSDWIWRTDPSNPRSTRDFLGRELSLLVIEGGGRGKDAGGAAPAGAADPAAAGGNAGDSSDARRSRR